MRHYQQGHPGSSSDTLIRHGSQAEMEARCLERSGHVQTCSSGPAAAAMAGGGRGSRRGRHGDNRCRRGVLEVLGELVAEEGRRHIVGGGGD
jgi:hypothetical protein